MTEATIETTTPRPRLIRRKRYTRKQVDRRLEAVINAIAKEIKQRDRKLLELSARLVALEARPIGAIDAGVFDPTRSYARGLGVSFDGGYWIAQTETRSVPGEGSPAWRLAVRRGRQGKEGRPCSCNGSTS